MVTVLVDPAAELANWRFDDTRSLGNALMLPVGDLAEWHQYDGQAFPGCQHG